MSKERFWFSPSMRMNELGEKLGDIMAHTEVLDINGKWQTYTVMSSKGNHHGCGWDDLVEITPMRPVQTRINYQP